MTNAVPALLALLLALSLPAVAVVSAAPLGDRTASTAPVANEDTTNRLALPGAVESGYAGTGPDLGTALATDDDALRADYDRFIADDEFAQRTFEQQQAAIDAAHDRLRDRIDALERRERIAVQRHADGELSDAELLRTLVRNTNEAAELADALDQLEDRADRVPGYSISVDSDQARLELHESPVRTRLDAASRNLGGPASVDVVVDTAADGYAVGMIDGGTYVREATRFDNREPTESDSFETPGTAESYVLERYPWAADNLADGSMGTIGWSAANLYRTNLPTVQGDLTVYLDGGTGDVHREVQALTIADLPTTAADRTWTNDSLELSLNETPANGPIEATVTDAETGEPVTATILVDEYAVGETDETGTLWLVPPSGEFELTAATDDGSVAATRSGS